MRMARIQTLVTPNFVLSLYSLLLWTYCSKPTAGDNVEHQELSCTAGGNAKWDNPFGRRILAASYKAQHTLLLWSSSPAPWCFPKEFKMYGHTETCIWMCIAALFTIARTWRPPRRPAGNEWSIQTVEYFSALKRNGLASHEKTQRNLKCILPSKRSQSEKAIYYMIPSIWHSGKGKTVETIQRSVVAGESTEDF